MSAPASLDIRDLYERYGRAVHRRCQYFLRSRADAEDAMHDVFLKLVERPEAFRGEAAPLTFVVRVTTNHCLNLLRSRRALWRDRYEKTVEVDGSHRESGQAAVERADLVRVLLDKLDRDTQTAAIYYFVDEMSQEEAAVAADCSVPTLRKRLRRFIEVARKELRRQDLDVVFGPPPV